MDSRLSPNGGRGEDPKGLIGPEGEEAGVFEAEAQGDGEGGIEGLLPFDGEVEGVGG